MPAPATHRRPPPVTPERLDKALANLAAFIEVDGDCPHLWAAFDTLEAERNHMDTRQARLARAKGRVVMNGHASA